MALDVATICMFSSRMKCNLSVYLTRKDACCHDSSRLVTETLYTYKVHVRSVTLAMTSTFASDVPSAVSVQVPIKFRDDLSVKGRNIRSLQRVCMWSVSHSPRQSTELMY